MKFLHTADWHLGVKTNGRDRLKEQKQVLDEIESIVTHENIDCIIIAGDVFNTASPSADAEELFFDSIQKLSANGDRFVFVLAGNHDDPTRLVAGLPLATKHNIALVGSLDRLKENSFNKNAIVKVIETGKGHIKIQKNEEIATIAYLPYPNEVRITEKVDSDLSYAEKVKAWADIAASAFSSEIDFLSPVNSRYILCVSKYSKLNGSSLYLAQALLRYVTSSPIECPIT